MPRVKGGPATRTRRKKVLSLAKGYVGSKKSLYRVANEQVLHSLSYAYRDRRNRKRDFKRLWIIRINAALRERGFIYSRFVSLAKTKNMIINKKILAFLSLNHPLSFDSILKTLKK